jgi:NAD(P)-dependent dehydrogenase (short-subunit alcohol dehydrogenase family)
MPSALVTGAGRGLGLEIARRLIGRGYDVALTDVDEGNVAAAAEQLGERAWSLPPNVAHAEACRVAADRVVERSGGLDVWINNAGILITGRSYEQEIEIHRRMLEVNAIGTYNGTLAAIEKMRAAAREPSRRRWKRAGGLPRSTAERAARPGRAGEPLPHRAGADADLRVDPLSRRLVDGA